MFVKRIFFSEDKLDRKVTLREGSFRPVGIRALVLAEREDRRGASASDVEIVERGHGVVRVAPIVTGFLGAV